jgi:hypothetical protein
LAAINSQRQPNAIRRGVAPSGLLFPPAFNRRIKVRFLLQFSLSYPLLRRSLRILLKVNLLPKEKSLWARDAREISAQFSPNTGRVVVLQELHYHFAAICIRCIAL